MVSTVESLSHVQLFVTHGLQARQASLSFTISWSLLKLMSIELVMPSNHLILYCSLLQGIFLNPGLNQRFLHCRRSLQSKPPWKSPAILLPSVFPSIRVFSSESALHIRWPKDWSFSFSISPSNEYSGLISFRIDWFDLAVQGTLKSLLHLKKQKTYI